MIVFHHVDFCGKELSVGDKCVFTKNTRTGSSTVRRIMYKGIITEIEQAWIFIENQSTGEIDKISSDDVVKVDWEQ